VDVPIINEVHAMLHQGKPVRVAVEDLLNREAKMED
jgi:glycerol-3-phosphate dehydrogenase